MYLHSAFLRPIDNAPLKTHCHEITLLATKSEETGTFNKLVQDCGCMENQAKDKNLFQSYVLPQPIK